MTERIYDNKFLGENQPYNPQTTQKTNSLPRGSNLLANKSNIQRQFQGDFGVNQKIKLQIGRKKLNNNNSNSNQSRNENSHGIVAGGIQSNSYTQNIDGSQGTPYIQKNSSNKITKGSNQNMIGGHSVQNETMKNQFQNNDESIKKPRRLRKNFDLLTQALKNSSTVKKDKKINFSSDSRAYNNTSNLVPSIYQQQQQNYIGDQNSPQVLTNKYQQPDSIAQLYQYGAHIQQQPFKDRKSSAYDILVNPQHQNQSQSQRVASHHSNNSGHNNTSLYSHISIKETTQTPQKNGSYSQSRNPSMMIYQNMPNNTQPLVVSDQKQFMRVNDKMMRRYMIGGEGGSNIPNNGLQNLISSGSNSQAILNINTASDINIYNNSFIVNTTSKKQSQSQGQSRSNSLKRNQQPVNAPSNINIHNQRVIKQQQHMQKILGHNQQNIGGNGMNIGNILQAHQNDYLVKYQNKPQSSSGRINSQQQIPRNQQQQQNVQSQQRKYSQIAEAYTAQNFFSTNGANNSHNLSQHQNINNPLAGMFTGSNQRLQIVGGANNKISSSKSLKKAQINHTQSFDLQPFNSSTDQEFHSSSNQSFHDISQQQYPMMVEDPNYSPNMRMIDSNKKAKLSQALLLQGKAKLLEKDYQAANDLFSQSINIDNNLHDAKFYRAVSNLDQGHTQDAIAELKEVLKISPDHSQIAHILLSIAYKRQNDITETINILNNCILKHSQYPDAYLARGQALLIQDQYDLALKDFIQYSQLMPNQGMGYIGAGDSQKALRLWKDSITSYTKAINLFNKSKNDEQSKQHIGSTYLKRGLSYYYVKQDQNALSDLQKVIQNDSSNFKAHFYIGKIYSRQYAVTPRVNGKVEEAQKIQNDAILHFEQVVKYQLNEIYAGNALFEIAKLRLKDKDFYEAYFNLKRAVDSNFTSKRLQLYKDFTEGVLYLIKRKIKKGVQILSDLLEVLVNSKEKKDKKQLEHLKHQAYIYRAYGYVAIEKYEVALSDIKRAKKISKLDAASIYNKLLGKGILRMDHEDYLMATKYFSKASLRFPLNKDPYCLYIISIVRSYTYSLADLTVDSEQKKEKVMNAKIFMDSAIKNCNKVRIPSLFFFRGLLFFQLHMFYEALKDFNVAIDEEEEPTASYYLARGRCYACLSILTEAMKDLSIALNIDDSLQEAYIYRGKCAYLLGDNNLAFLDFQRLILTDPKNPMVHVYAGNLLMTTGAYQDAIKAFMNADTVQKTAVAAFQRARCFCALTDLENAKIQFKSAIDLCKNEFFVKIDSQCLSALMKVISSANQNQQNKEKIINEAIDIMNSLMETFKSPKIKELQKKDAKLNIQVIPNVKRIKIEKVAVARELIASQSDQKDLTISIDMNQTIDLDQLQHISLYSYYYENVFQLEDFYLFRAVFNFYRKNYEQSISDYGFCREQRLNENDGNQTQTHNNNQYLDDAHNLDHQEAMMMYSKNSQSSTPISMNSSKTDLSDVGLCSLNTHETNFNILLCYLMMNDMQNSLSKLSELIGQSPKKYQKYFFLIRALVYEKLGMKDKSQKDIIKLEKQEPKIHEIYFKENKEIFFEPFPIKNRLCSKFETVKITIFAKRPTILTKPSFSMPFIKPPNMIPNIDEEVIQNEFTLKQIDAPMPEAPWIRRCEYGIKFTDDILQDDEFDLEETNNQIQTKDQPESEKKTNQNQKVMNDIEISMQKDQLIQQKKKNQPADQSQDVKQNAPLKPNHQKKGTRTIQDESPYTQSFENNNGGFQINGQKNGNQKGIGERILQNATVYLVDNEEDDQLSDKHKISLFDDSKFEDLTIDQSKSGNYMSKIKGKNMILGNGAIDSIDQIDELMQQNLIKDSRDEEDDDDDSSEDEDYESLKAQTQIIQDRDSMVLMGENVIKGLKKKNFENKSKSQKNNNVLLNNDSDNEEKHKLLSELQSNIDLEEDLKEGQRDSIFRSKQSSRR